MISKLYLVFCSVLFPKTWSEFVTCIKRYTSDCLTPNQVTAVNIPSSAANRAGLPSLSPCNKLT